MNKLDNFTNCLNVLKTADFEFASDNVIYRTGVIGQFNLTFELAWKAPQAVLKLHGAEGAESGSPQRNSSVRVQTRFCKRFRCMAYHAEKA